MIERVIVTNDAGGSWVFNGIIWKKIERWNGQFVEVSISATISLPSIATSFRHTEIVSFYYKDLVFCF